MRQGQCGMPLGFLPAPFACRCPEPAQDVRQPGGCEDVAGGLGGMGWRGAKEPRIGSCPKRKPTGDGVLAFPLCNEQSLFANMPCNPPHSVRRERGGFVVRTAGVATLEPRKYSDLTGFDFFGFPCCLLFSWQSGDGPLSAAYGC